MGIANKLSNNVQAWGVLAIIVVIVSIVLTKFKTSNAGSITCPSTNSSHLYYNSSSNLCCAGSSFTTNTAGCGSGSTAVGGVAGTLDTFVSSLAEPKNWVAIVIIALIGFSMLKLFRKK